MANSKKVLILDPSPFFRSTIRKVLQTIETQLYVSEAKNTTEAEHILNIEQPDVMFMDIALPNNDGVPFLETVKSRYPDVCLIVLTSHDSIEYQKASLLRGANYFLSKERSSRLHLREIINSTILKENAN
jgi:DNA-binding NarL/FixJ family response regulator